MIKFKLTEQIKSELKNKLVYHEDLMRLFNSKKTVTRNRFLDCLVEKDYFINERYLYDGNMIIEKLLKGNEKWIV